MEALHDLDHMFRQWLSAMRLFAASASGTDRARARPAPSHASRPSLSAMSRTWLLEHEIASGKHRDDP